MDTKNSLKSDRTPSTNANLTQITCTATKGNLITNPQTRGSLKPVTPIAATDSVTMNSNKSVSFNFNVDIDSNFNGTPTFWVNIATKDFYVEFDHTEEWTPKVYNWQIQATYDNSNGSGGYVLAAGDEITIYNRDTDPITSSGKKVTVQPST